MLTVKTAVSRACVKHALASCGEDLKDVSCLPSKQTIPGMPTSVHEKHSPRMQAIPCSSGFKVNYERVAGTNLGQQPPRTKKYSSGILAILACIEEWLLSSRTCSLATFPLVIYLRFMQAPQQVGGNEATRAPISLNNIAT